MSIEIQRSIGQYEYVKMVADMPADAPALPRQLLAFEDLVDELKKKPEVNLPKKITCGCCGAVGDVIGNAIGWKRPVSKGVE